MDDIFFMYHTLDKFIKTPFFHHIYIYILLNNTHSLLPLQKNDIKKSRAGRKTIIKQWRRERNELLPKLNSGGGYDPSNQDSNNWIKIKYKSIYKNN